MQMCSKQRWAMGCVSFCRQFCGRGVALRKHSLTHLLAVALILGAAAAQATVRTWIPAGVDSNWFNAANWSPSDSWPTNGDAALIMSNKFVLLTNSTDNLESLTITNATLMFTNWNTALIASNVTIRNKGSLTHAPCNTNLTLSNTNRVYILCTNLLIDAGGSIYADSAGFTGAPNSSVSGQGPGGGKETGGSYGGKGGINGYTLTAIPTAPYGSSSVPVNPGSGGGCTHNGQLGSSGGGAVWIEASGQVVLNGAITANGASADDSGGAGSGGGIYISCYTFLPPMA